LHRAANEGPYLGANNRGSRAQDWREDNGDNGCSDCSCDGPGELLEELAEAEVAGGVNAVDGVVFDIGVPVETLGVSGLGDDRVRGDEAPQDGIIVAGVIEVQACFGVLLLSRIAVLVEIYGALVGVGLAEGAVSEALDLGPLAVGEDIQAPQVVPVLSKILARVLLISATGMSCGLT
jgi:hypothetical protein